MSTPATAGPWDAGSQHAGPPSALFARAFERHEPIEGQRLARVAVDILRPVPVAPLTLRVRTVRPGRRITLVEGVAEADGQEVLHARGWRLARGPQQPSGSGADPGSEAGAGAVPALPPVSAARPWPGVHAGGYMEAMEWRFVSGDFVEPGPARVWMRPRLPLVAGEETSPFCRTMMIADSGNGVSARLDPARWLFVNVDLTVVLHRDPRGEWVLMDAVTTIGPDGAALAASRLSDHDGPVGQGMQTLVVTPR
ncbi:thioesterase family protein [Planosporangium thailandense]|uniref:Thioesterase family protein n=2 Tax=Planosporangium thailandense TaxID=765197 RepID=A0ABX0Y6S2_9ACTN|nr:thioesterase family protein [Planosporangium thailandense]NJC72994.1 thioesterase family protein [Planosporangium thailandense]